MKYISLLGALKLSEEALKILGWKGGNGFNAWIDEDGYYIGFDSVTDKKPSRYRLNKLKHLYYADECYALEKGDGSGGWWVYVKWNITTKRGV